MMPVGVDKRFWDCLQGQ